MMQRMHIPIERPDMQQPMPPVKMKRHPESGQPEQRDKPDRVFGKADHRRKAARLRPEQANLIGCPERQTTRQRPEHIVIKLGAKGKARAAAMSEPADIFALCPLDLAVMQQPVKATGEQHQQKQIAQPHLDGPPPFEPANTAKPAKPANTANTTKPGLMRPPATDRQNGKQADLRQGQPAVPVIDENRPDIQRPVKQRIIANRQLRRVVPLFARLWLCHLHALTSNLTLTLILTLILP